jgi:hypothetical protein
VKQPAERAASGGVGGADGAAEAGPRVQPAEQALLEGWAALTELQSVSLWPKELSGPLPKWWGPANKAIGAKAHLVQPSRLSPPPSPEAVVRSTEAEMLH